MTNPGSTASRARRTCAVLLALLIASPFTAPFSFCPLASLLGDAPGITAAAPVMTTASYTGPISGSQSVPTEEQMKDDVMLSGHPGHRVVVVVEMRYRSLIVTGIVSPALTPLVLRV